MSWMSRLYEAYEQGAASEASDEHKLLPVSHTVGNAHINVVIDGLGNLRRANVLEKMQIHFPATEKSAGRSSGEAPHPLADKLQYVAADYADYGGLKGNFFEGYKAQLERWCVSECSHPSARAVFAYVSKRCVIADLVTQKILWLDDSGNLLTAWADVDDVETDPPKLFRVLPKEKGLVEQGNALVCWTVESSSILCSETWLDKELQASWIAYESSSPGTTAFCYVTGENAAVALSHPAKLRHSGDKAKLISSNDFNGFTFKGRFTDTNKSVVSGGFQSVGVGSTATQKSSQRSTLAYRPTGFPKR